MLIQLLRQRFATREAGRSATIPLAWSLDVLTDAIRRHREVVAFHGKEWLVFCPYDLRHSNGEPEVLAYLVFGHPYLQTSVPSPPCRWVWLPVAELWGVEARGAAPATSAAGRVPGTVRGERQR